MDKLFGIDISAKAKDHEPVLSVEKQTQVHVGHDKPVEEIRKAEVKGTGDNKSAPARHERMMGHYQIVPPSGPQFDESDDFDRGR